MARSRFRVVPVLVAACATPALTQAPAQQATQIAVPSPTAGSLVIPALTPVMIAIVAPLGSKISRTGDSFPIRLEAPIMVDGKEAVPAGAIGIGEVVHAKKSGGMGAAGELVLAARYLEVNGQRLLLRSMNLSSTAKSNIDTVNALNVGSAASPIPFGLVGFFISGGQITVPPGAIAQAKTRESFTVPTSAGTTSAAAPPANSFTGGQ